MTPIIEINNLSKRFNREVLSGVNFHLAENQILGLIGRNGAGKTTLIKIILGFLKPSEGMVRVFGKEPGQAIGAIGYLPEKPDYHLLFSGKEYLSHLARISGLERVPERVRELLALVGLEGHGSLPMSRYSKGMLQRLGLAQALLNDPALVILDEPLTGLDPAGQKDLRDIIVQLGSLNKTILLCSHLLGEVEKVCSEVAMLHQGEIIEQGKINDLLQAQDSFKLRLSGLTPELLKLLHQAYSIQELEAGVIILCQHKAGEKEAFMKSLIEQGVLINELVPFRRTLEEQFLLATGSDNL